MITTYIKDVTLELTRACALNCIHCYLPIDKNVSYVPLSDVKKIINQAYEINALQMTFTGGEAAFHPDIIEILEYTLKKGFSVNLLTSLYGIKDYILENIFKYCHRINTSLYGHNADVHDQITNVHGSFEQTTKVLKRYKKQANKVKVNVTLLRNNFKFRREIKEYINDIGFNSFFYIKIFNNLSKSRDTSNIEITKEQAYKYMRETWLPYKEQFASFLYCAAGVKELWIDVEQNVFPCVFFKQCLGNLKQDTLYDIWHHSPAVNQLKDLNESMFHVCKTCSVKKYCQQCIGENYNDNYSLFIPSENNCCYSNLLLEVLQTEVR